MYGFCVVGISEGHCAGDEGAPVAALDDYIDTCVLVGCFFGVYVVRVNRTNCILCSLVCSSEYAWILRIARVRSLSVSCELDATRCGKG